MASRHEVWSGLARLVAPSTGMGFTAAMPDALDLSAVFEASPNAYTIVDRELRYVAANRAYLEVTSSRIDELIGRRIIDVFPHDPDDLENDSRRRLAASLERVLASGEPDVLAFIHYRIRLPASAGGGYEERYWSATHTPLRSSDGSVQFVLQHTVNVTDLHASRHEGATFARDRKTPVAQVEAGVLRRAERVQQQNLALSENLRGLLEIFDQAPGFLCFLRGPEHVFELSNRAYEQLVGGRKLMGLSVRAALPEVEAGYFELLDRVFTSGQPFVGREMTVELRHEPGGPIEQRIVDFVYQPILDAAGRALGVLVVGNDITEHKRAQVAEREAQQKAARSQAELEAIFESFPEALYVGDASGVKRANAYARDLLGYETVGEVLRPQSALVAAAAPRRTDTDEPLAADETPFALALKGQPCRMAITIKHQRTGEERVIFCSGAPVRVAGAPIAAVVTQIDISEQKRAETRALQLARVLDSTPDFVGIADLDGSPSFVNAAGLALVGLPDLAAARALPVSHFFVESQRGEVMDVVLPTALTRGYWAGELSFRKHDTGEEIPVLYTVFPLRDSAGKVSALATITRDLRAQKAAEAERAELLAKERAARAQAEEANLLKDQFLATISHELRTPLSSIMGWIQMLRAGMVSEEKRGQTLAVIERNARVQAQLIEDLLDVSRIISDKFTLDLEPLDIAGVISAAVETVRPNAQAKGLRLVVDAEQVGAVQGDARRLQQVLWNLLTNAVKFTPRGGEVKLRVERERSEVVVRVSDTGCGIAAEFLPHVFERFRQAEGSSVRKLGGLGLGLSIARHVVLAHGGEVEAYSAGPGQGATFTVRLPLLGADSLLPPASVGAPLELGQELSGLHVLLVEDEPDTREYVCALLERVGARVTPCSNASDALAALLAERPDILISDLAMPEEDGFQLIRRIRALPDERTRRLPAVALTAYASAEDRTRAMLAGFQNHVKKPIDARELLAVIASLSTGVAGRSR